MQGADRGPGSYNIEKGGFTPEAVLHRAEGPGELLVSPPKTSQQLCRDAKHLMYTTITYNRILVFSHYNYSCTSFNRQLLDYCFAFAINFDI